MGKVHSCRPGFSQPCEYMLPSSHGRQHIHSREPYFFSPLTPVPWLAYPYTGYALCPESMESGRRRVYTCIANLAETLPAVAARLANRPLIFSVAAVSVLSAKLLHIYAHLDALQFFDIFGWGWSFFIQDTISLLLLRLLLDLGLTAIYLGFLFAAYNLVLASTSISFFIVAGTELRWRNVNVAGDPSAWKMLLTGLVSLLIVMAAIIVLAFILQTLCFVVADACLALLQVPLRLFQRWVARLRRRDTSEEKLDLLPWQEYELDDSDTAYEPDFASRRRKSFLQSSGFLATVRVVVAVSVSLQVLSLLLRPTDSSMAFLSWTLPLMPVVHNIVGSTLSSTIPMPESLLSATALGQPPHFDWLPENQHSGFCDWYTNRTHYNAKQDFLKVSNAEDDLLEGLNKVDLKKVPIKHVMLIKLESTRKDVFPLRMDEGILDGLASGHPHHHLPPHLVDILASLTPNARYLTGELDSGFPTQQYKIDRHGKTSRGGISAQNAFTTATYTLKSLAGTHCGITPLTADFNREYDQHIYQPCLPHIFDAFNDMKCDGDSSKWTSTYMQSTTLGYDKQNLLMPQLGFAPDKIIGGTYLKSDGHKFAPANMSDVNYYGMPEIAIENYLRDAFATAKAKGERLFLSHLTSTSHHPFRMPEDERPVRFAADRRHRMLSRYLNAIGYVDRWLGKVFDILEEENVADETLVVLVGDHGLSVAEQSSTTPYHNPNVANFHVPLVLSHPGLPNIKVTDPVTSLQILPTILDLLVETRSLSTCESKAARQLLANYEGQSLIRPQRTVDGDNKPAGWQFTVMNPGGSGIAVRDANKPDWRLIVPMQAGSEWRLTDLSVDPYEVRPMSSFDFNTLVRRLESMGKADKAEWVREAVKISAWWVRENHKRWRYTP